MWVSVLFAMTTVGFDLFYFTEVMPYSGTRSVDEVEEDVQGSSSIKRKIDGKII